MPDSRDEKRSSNVLSVHSFALGRDVPLVLEKFESVEINHEFPDSIPLAADRSALLLERIHDLRVVWAFKIQVQADLVRDPHELGHCIF